MKSRILFKQFSQPVVRDEGFALIELLIVLLTVGTLLAITIPAFLTVTQSASSTVNLQTALTGADVYYTQNGGSYDAAPAHIVTDLDGLGTGLDYVLDPAPSTAAGVVSVDEVDTNDLVLASYSERESRCFYIADDKGGALAGNLPAGAPISAVETYYGYTADATRSSCVASAYTAVATTGGAAGTGAWQITGGFPS